MSALATIVELALTALDKVLSRATERDRAAAERMVELKLRKRRELREKAQARLDAQRKKR